MFPNLFYQINATKLAPIKPTRPPHSTCCLTPQIRLLDLDDRAPGRPLARRHCKAVVHWQGSVAGSITTTRPLLGALASGAAVAESEADILAMAQLRQGILSSAMMPAGSPKVAVPFMADAFILPIAEKGVKSVFSFVPEISLPFGSKNQSKVRERLRGTFSYERVWV